MATAKSKRPAAKKTTARKGTGGKKSTSSRARKSTRRDSAVSMPAVGLMILGVGILLFFTLVTPTNAMLIVAVRGFINSAFGKVGWVAMILLCMLGLQIAFGDRWPLRKVVWFQLALIMLAVATLLQVFRMDTIELYLRREQGLPEDYYSFLWRSQEASRTVPDGGGVLGALLAYPMWRYLDTPGSVLILFFAIFALGFWLVRTIFPSAGEYVGGWFAQLRDDYMEQREERALEREANAALLVPLPEELDEIPLEEKPAKRVAKGRKTTAPAKPKAPPPEPQPPAPKQMEVDWERAAPAKPAPAPVKPRPAKKTRLYIENDGPRRRDPAQEAYTEHDAERFKYASRPSRKDPNAIPEFILKRRAMLDEEYGTAPTNAAEPAPYGEAQIEPLADSPSWDGEPIIQEVNYMDGEAFEAETEPPYEPYEEPEYIEPPAPPPARAPRKKAHAPNPLDRQPELDPETRLDRPDWKPPEPEIVEEALPEDNYRQPPFSLLVRDEKRARIDTRDADSQNAQKLEETLASFGVSAHVTKVVHGPAITRYELQPAPGVKVSKIVGLTDDIALNMAAVGVRIEAPIPGKAAIGIEIANEEIQTVFLRDVLESDESLRNPSKLAVALGKDVAGKRIIADLARMPHLLIAGATGSGKSVCINTLITSIIYRATPEEVRLILIDPKKVELNVYNGIPHLLVPVVIEPKKASGALNWAVMEMDARYKVFAEMGVRDIKGYNAHRDADTPLMPQIVIIIDELSDLMLVAPGEVEESICRIAQLARACGIHLVIATQRPSVNVITGIIKANVPSRIAFAVSSQVDSRTILDGAGAEKLLGRGDMLYAPSGGGKPMRVQGCFVSDDEVTRVVEFVKNRHDTDYSQAVIEALNAVEEQNNPSADDGDGGEVDALFVQAIEMAIEGGQISISMLQRRMRIGYARAGRIVDDMSRKGIIGPADGAKPREVLMTREEFTATYGGE